MRRNLINNFLLLVAVAFSTPRIQASPNESNAVIEAFVRGEWKKIADGKTNGHGTKKDITPVTAQKFLLTMECDKGSPGVAELRLYPAD